MYAILCGIFLLKQFLFNWNKVSATNKKSDRFLTPQKKYFGDTVAFLLNAGLGFLGCLVCFPHFCNVMFTWLRTL